MERDPDVVRSDDLADDTIEQRHTSPVAFVWVGAALVVLFVLITFLNRAYLATRRSRAESRYTEGVQLANAGHNTQAAADFRAALVYEHDDPKYRFALAKALISMGRWDEAENHLLELKERDPTDGPINRMLARLARRAGRYDEAIDDYNSAIYGFWPENSEQNRIETRMELIDVLDHEHRRKQVLAELLALAAEIPDKDLAMRRQVGAMLLSHGSPQHAAETYRGILATHPHDGGAAQGLGEAEFELGDLIAARNAYRSAARDGNSDPVVTRRIEVINEILGLDPTLASLTASQRYNRAMELLRRTAASASACTAVPPDLADPAGKILLANSRRKRDGEAAAALTLAQQLWSLREQACPEKPTTDPALVAVMARIAKQQ